MNDADDAVGGSLTTADLVAQARAAAFDAQSQEALTLINRGNGAANEAKWQDAVGVVDAALRQACDRRLVGRLRLRNPYTSYVAGHEQIRELDDGGDWDTAVGDQPRQGERRRPTRTPICGDHRAVRHVRQHQRASSSR